MILDGPNFRKVSERDNFSFDASFSVSHPTGVGVFGFSGYGQEFAFNFQSGKIIDPEDTFFRISLIKSLLSLEMSIRAFMITQLIKPLFA